MGKTVADKQVNRVARKLNKSLKKDVFGNRFEIHQVQKAKGKETGFEYYLYELVDNIEPERNRIIGWRTWFEITQTAALHREMNDFIVSSNFWQLYLSKK